MILRPVTRALRIAAATLCLASMAVAQTFVWFEGETPTSANFEGNAGGWGNKHFMSGESWLHISIGADKVKEAVPEGGILLAYDFDAPAAGKYEVWARIGFEFIRAPFDWRVGENEWKRVEPADLTTDLMEIGLWCELAWLQLGTAQLDAGTHAFEIRIPVPTGNDGNAQPIVFALDAVCLSLEPFIPHSRFKPGEDWRTDRDLEAAAHIFKLPETPAGTRSVLPLNGLWEVARNDEQLPPADIAVPMADFPAQFRWTAIDVPGDKNSLRPDLVFCHRLWHRARVEIPEGMAGRAFFVTFPENSLNTTVFVNGEYCGFSAFPFAEFNIDISAAVKPGVNEIWVGIRDAWYGYSTNPNDPMKLRKKFNYPTRVFGYGYQELAWPVWGTPRSGILLTPSLTAAGGPVYASDVFAKPSVSKRELAVEVTVLNPWQEAADATVTLEAVNTKTGETEKKFAAVNVALDAGGEKMVEITEAWADPKLWWPDEPNLYWLRATVETARPPRRDVSDTRFGFREWDWAGRGFKLNGVPWRGWADVFTASSKEEWLKRYREYNQTFMRFSDTRWMGMPPRDALNFFDENGVVVRYTGILNGLGIGYQAIEHDPDLKDLYGSVIKMDLMRNWQGQVAAQIRGERNHPSVMVWSLENEYLFINCFNMHRDILHLFEAEITKASDAVMALDPTRPTMVDGGGACKDNSLPVHGDHYINGLPNLYPPFAYTANTQGGGRGYWEWDEQRPRFIGEDFYMTGIHPEAAYFQGDSAFTGKPAIGVGIWNRMLQEGYRWADQNAWQFWLAQTDNAGIPYIAYAPRAVFSKEWNWTFESGADVRRTFGVFNDSRFDDPITFTWTLTLDGEVSATRAQTFNIPAGGREVLDEILPMPKIAGARREAELVLELRLEGEAPDEPPIFTDTKRISILAPQKRELPGITKNDLLVFDPGETVSAFLAAQNIPFTAVASLDEVEVAPASSRSILLIGGNALDAREAASSRLSAFAAAGRRVVVLDQDHPLRHQGMPAEMEVSPAMVRGVFQVDYATDAGYTAFIEDAAHPVFAGLADKDFFTWVDFETPVYRNVYDKPARGARSLMQCHDTLRHTALAEIHVGAGLMIPCQLNVSARLADNPVAQQLVLNLLGHAAAYELEHVPVHAFFDGAPQLKNALDMMGLQYTTLEGETLSSLGRPNPGSTESRPPTLIINATPEVLKTLADNLDAVKNFTAAGGSIILCGVTPEGLADFNKIVGVDHIMRPFVRERVMLPVPRSRLTSGLTSADITLFSSQRIFHWTEGNYTASDVFSHVVDYDNPAPFAASTFPHYPNIVNGFVTADGWPLIINFNANEDGSPFQVPITFPKEFEFTEFTWIGNTLYSPQTKINLVFDNDRGSMLAFDTAPNNEPHVFTLDPPRKATEITLEIAEWIPTAGNTIGIDNIGFKVKRPDGFYNTVKPLVNIGGLMEYEMGAGRVVLCNLLFQENEAVPENAGKKRRVLSTVLHNLKAPFAAGKTVIAGMNLNYTPLDISSKSTQYRNAQGWFGDPARSFKDFPHGRQRMAGVPFDIYEMATSIVPNALMLRGGGIPGDLPQEILGIPVNLEADALFFLHAARVDRRRNATDVREGRFFELAKYVVRYADGEAVEVPIFSERDIDHYAQQTPAVVAGSQIAWMKKFEGADETAVAYMAQWNNPRPGVAIATVDLLPGADNAGVPVLLALTAAQAE